MNTKPTKTRFLDRVAEETGVAIVVLDAQSHEISTSNNNSICASLWNSEADRPLCLKYCGRAFERTGDSGEPIEYVCHAGLTCRAVRVTDRGSEFVAVIGRIFLRGENYRAVTERAISGDWSKFRPTEFFTNILLSGSASGIGRAIEKLGRFIVKHENDILDIGSDRSPHPIPAAEPIPDREIENKIAEFNRNRVSIMPPSVRSLSEQHPSASEAAQWRSLFSTILKLDYFEACQTIVEFLQRYYSFRSVVWLDRRGDVLVSVRTDGSLESKTVRISLPVKSERLAAAAKNERALLLKERRPEGKRNGERHLHLFPISVDADVRSAFAVEGMMDDKDLMHELFRFAKTIGPQIEILRLREEVSRRRWVSEGVKRFTDNLRGIDQGNFWSSVTQISAELLEAERASLLVRNEKTNSLYVKASLGSAADLQITSDIGVRIAMHTLNQGEPFVVNDMKAAGIASAPREWKYKTSSFISFPIVIGDRKIAVMNFTDRAGGHAFGEKEIEFLQTIAPQIAVAMDRTTLKDRAGEFEQLSVTDPLTGLLNRRYLDERIDEEMNRARRHRSEISLMMVDVDNFKSYNDSFGHPAGDTALKMVAAAMKDTLRADDIAARFGGEEFAILLPRTNAEEAAAIAERIRARVEHTAFQHRKITISIGIAGHSNEFETSRDWISAADMALYEAKHLGRNNIRVYDKMGRSFKEGIN